MKNILTEFDGLNEFDCVTHDFDGTYKATYGKEKLSGDDFKGLKAIKHFADKSNDAHAISDKIARESDLRGLNYIDFLHVVNGDVFHDMYRSARGKQLSDDLDFKNYEKSINVSDEFDFAECFWTLNDIDSENYPSPLSAKQLKARINAVYNLAKQGKDIKTTLDMEFPGHNAPAEEITERP